MLESWDQVRTQLISKPLILGKTVCNIAKLLCQVSNMLSDLSRDPRQLDELQSRVISWYSDFKLNHTKVFTEAITRAEYVMQSSEALRRHAR